MNIRIFQKGFNYSQDGPGNRLVYHLQGCNMRCPWCANPEGIQPGQGTVCDVEDILDEINRSKSMFFDGGGVTFTGGEPTLQFDALRYLLGALRQRGIHTAIETNGTHPQLRELFRSIDFLIMDFKQPFSERHRSILGVSSTTLLDNLRLACAEHPSVLIRIPLVNGYNASPEEMERFAQILENVLPSTVCVEPLRYHEYGRVKWERLGMDYTVRDGFISEAQMNNFLDILHAHGLRTIRT